MLVFDLQCSAQHVFEGWFAGVDDFQQQCQRGLLLCPLCGDSAVSRRLSAPRLNLGTRLEPPDRELRSSDEAAEAGTPSASVVDAPENALQRAWVEAARHIVASTEDMGNNFSLEARRIHYGEVVERGIRGYATLAETLALLDEGIAVMPLVLPEAFKKTLQ